MSAPPVRGARGRLRRDMGTASDAGARCLVSGLLIVAYARRGCRVGGHGGAQRIVGGGDSVWGAHERQGLDIAWRLTATSCGEFASLTRCTLCIRHELDTRCDVTLDSRCAPGGLHVPMASTAATTSRREPSWRSWCGAIRLRSVGTEHAPRTSSRGLRRRPISGNRR